MPTRNAPKTASLDPVVVATAADDRYALALAVMGRSLIDNFSRRRELVLYIIDGGIDARNRRRILGSWDLTRVDIRWVKPRPSRLRGVPVFSRFGLATYFRVLIPELLPRAMRRAIYVDADTLILDDISKLWRTSLEEKPLAAVQDPGVQFMGDSFIPRSDIQVSLKEVYFNAGVLLMDLDRWRKDGFVQKVLEYLHRRRKEVVFPDQDAMNVVFAGQWCILHPRWNLCQGGRPLRDIPRPQRLDHAEAIARPGILHFLFGPKPWQKGSRNQRLFLYHYYLDRTRWAGWRPD